MDDALFVRRLECLGHLRRDPEAFAQGNRSAGDSLREIVTIDEFDDESGDAVAFFESVDRRNVGMIQRREHLRFPLEAGEPLGTVCHLGQQDLDRDVAAKPRVAGAEDRAHAAFAQQRLHLEDTEPGSS